MGESQTSATTLVQNKEIDKAKLWHLRLGHIEDKDLNELQNQALLEIEKLSDLTSCEECLLGKSTRVRFKTAIHQTKQTLYYIHFDLLGPSRVASHASARYFFVYY